MEAVGNTAQAQEELMRLAKAAEDATLSEALTDGGDLMLAGMRAQIAANAKHQSGKLASALKYRLNTEYLSGRAYAATFGWEKIARRRSKKSGHTWYTSDYGPVLEYDSTRSLKHMEQGFEDTKDQAQNAMIAVIRGAMDKGG